MKIKARPLLVSTSTTVTFLCIGAVLVILGIFNSFLEWDIFGPQFEKVLYGIFVSSVTLGAFGVAITIVLGIQEVVKSINRLGKTEEDISINSYKFSFKKYVLIFMGLILALTVLVTAFATANHFIQEHRNKTFKKIATEELQRFEPNFQKIFKHLSLPGSNTIPDEFYDIFQTIENLSFVYTVEIYIPDPKDNNFMWKNSIWQKYDNKNGVFTRFFVSKDYEIDIKNLIEGNQDKLHELNNKKDFIWYYPVKNRNDVPVAVLRITGNTKESFRDYTLKK